MRNPSEFLKFAIRLAKKAGEIQLSYFGNIDELETKSNDIDLVTIADKESEKYIIDSIIKKYPSHSILSEESIEISNNDNYTWVIDPLDGTTNFVHNLPIFSVSIALKKNNKTIIGVVYNPAANKCFYAEKNKGAFLNNDVITTRSNTQLSKSLIVTGFPYIHDKRYDLSFKIFKEFYDNTRGVRRLGAASLDLCFVAMGRFDGFYEYELKAWDICAGALIASEANAILSDWDGSELPDSGKRILACSNNEIHNHMKSILNCQKYKLFF